MEYQRVKLVTSDNGQHIDNGPIKIRIIEDGSNTTHRLGITEVRLAPAATGPPQHVHRAHEETFYVISGLVRFTCGEEHVDVTPGGLITAPIGAPHTFANPDPDQNATMLATFTPSLYIRYFQEMSAMALGPDGITDEAYLELMSKYHTEPYPPA